MGRFSGSHSGHVATCSIVIHVTTAAGIGTIVSSHISNYPNIPETSDFSSGAHGTCPNSTVPIVPPPPPCAVVGTPDPPSGIRQTSHISNYPLSHLGSCNQASRGSNIAQQIQPQLFHPHHHQQCCGGIYFRSTLW
jgi:hypothetical protein